MNTRCRDRIRHLVYHSRDKPGENGILVVFLVLKGYKLFDDGREFHASVVLILFSSMHKGVSGRDYADYCGGNADKRRCVQPTSRAGPFLVDLLRFLNCAPSLPGIWRLLLFWRQGTDLAFDLKIFRHACSRSTEER